MDIAIKLTAALLMAVLTASGASAQDATDSEIDDIMGGFEDEFPAAEPSAREPEEIVERAWELNGSATLASSYNYAHKKPAPGATDYRGLSRLRAELQLDLDVDLPDNWKMFVSGRGFYDFAYDLNGRDRYNDDVLTTYGDELEFRDVYLQGKLHKNVDVKIGRQIIVWGRSDNFRVTDVLNPMDLREPGMVDIEDLRLPVTMTRID